MKSNVNSILCYFCIPSILGPGDRPTHAPVMLGPGPAYIQQAPPPGAVVTSQPPPLVHMVQQGGVLQGPPPPPPGGQYGMWPPASGAPVGDPAIDPRKGENKFNFKG